MDQISAMNNKLTQQVQIGALPDLERSSSPVPAPPLSTS